MRQIPVYPNTVPGGRWVELDYCPGLGYDMAWVWDDGQD